MHKCALQCGVQDAQRRGRKGAAAPVTACAPHRSITSSRLSAARLVTAFALGMPAYARSSTMAGQCAASASYAASPSFTHLRSIACNHAHLICAIAVICACALWQGGQHCAFHGRKQQITAVHAAVMCSPKCKGAGHAWDCGTHLVKSTCVSCVQPLARRSTPRSVTALQPLRLMRSKPGQQAARALSVSSPTLRFQYCERRFRAGVARTRAATPLSVSLQAEYNIGTAPLQKCTESVPHCRHAMQQ